VTELERHERHEAEIAAWFELTSGMTAVEYLEALDRINKEGCRRSLDRRP
jgi:hypothetical protein